MVASLDLQTSRELPIWTYLAATLCGRGHPILCRPRNVPVLLRRESTVNGDCFRASTLIYGQLRQEVLVRPLVKLAISKHDDSFFLLCCLLLTLPSSCSIITYTNNNKIISILLQNNNTSSCLFIIIITSTNNKIIINNNQSNHHIGLKEITPIHGRLRRTQ